MGPFPNWRFCEKCNAMFFDGRPAKGTCPAGGGHQSQGFNFMLTQNVPQTDNAQSSWSFCEKCVGLFFNGFPSKGVCPSGGGHQPIGENIVLPHDVPQTDNAQASWRFCEKCNVMFFDGFPSKGVCPAGGGHESQGFNFVLPHDLPEPAAMMNLTIAVPSFHIESLRSAHRDTLFATTACVVKNQDGSIFHDYGSTTVALGDKVEKETVSLNIPLRISIPVPPAPLNQATPGASVSWTFLLTNSGHQGDTSAITKALTTVATGLASKAGTDIGNKIMGPTPVGPSSSGDTSASDSGDGGGSSISGPIIVAAVAAAIEGITELISLLTANCDGVVAQQTYVWSAFDLFHMVVPGKIWTQVKRNAGTDSPSGCGSNSEYDVTYLVAETPPTPLPPH